MKSLKQYFLEYSTPDGVDHVIDEQPVSFDYMSNFAYPFFYNTKTNEIIIGVGGETHGRTLDKYVDTHSDWRKKFNIDSSKYDYIITPLDLIFTRFSDDESSKPQHIIFGRIWDLTNVYEYEEINDKTSGGVKQFIIAYWNELDNKLFKNVTDTIINKFCKDNNYNLLFQISVFFHPPNIFLQKLLPSVSFFIVTLYVFSLLLQRTGDTTQKIA